MNLFLYLTNFIVPFLILAIIVYGLLMKINVYEHFIKGCPKRIFNRSQDHAHTHRTYGGSGYSPRFRVSGDDFLLYRAVYCCHWISGELVPLTVVKMFSSSAATGLLLDLYKEFGTDSLIGLIASISMSCTETIFYTMSVYFMTAKIKNSRYTLTGALIATFAGLAASVVLSQFMLQ